MESAKRFDSLDLIKVIAIVMVISQHIPLYDYDFINNGKVLEFMFKLLSEGVPLFLAVNGFLLLRKKDLDIKKHYKKVAKMLVLVFVWEAILITVGMLFDKTVFNPGLVLDLFFRTGGENAVYTSHLWYMQALIAIYCIYPLIWKAYNDNYDLFKIIFIILCVFTCLSGTIEMISKLVNYEGYAKMINYVSEYINRFTLFGNYKWQLLYFCLGGVINKNLEVIRKKKILFIIVGVVSWLLAFVYGYLISVKNNQTCSGFFNASTVFMSMTVIGWFALCDAYTSKGIIGETITKIGKNTFGIYVTHTYFLRVAGLFISNSSFILRLLTVFVTLILSYLFTIIIKKIPYLNKLLQF